MLQVFLIAILFGVFNLTASVKASPDPSADPQQASWGVLDHELAHGNLDHKLEALAALATIPGTNDQAVKRVEGALRDSDAQVRQAACLALGQMKAKQAAPYLKQALDDTGEVAFAAAKGLTDIGDPSGQDMLIAVLAGQRKDTPGILTNAMREARRRLRHPQGLIFDGAENATGAMFGPAGMAFTAAQDTMDLKGKGTPGRAAAVAYIAKEHSPYSETLLEWALSDDSPAVRAEAAKGLGKCGNAGSIPKLQFLLTDDRTRVRTMAAAAIIRIISGGAADEALRSKGK